MEISTLTEKGQATIPAKFRKALGLKPKDSILFEQLESGEIVIRPLPRDKKDWGRFLGHALQDELSSKADDEAYGDL